MTSTPGVGGSAGASSGARPKYEILTPALLLLGPWLHQLRSHGYPLLRVDVLIVAAGTVIIGLLLGVCIHRARAGLRLTLVVLLLALVWDLYGAGGSLQWAVISVGTIILVVLALRAHVVTIAFAVSVPVLLSTLLPPVQRVEASSVAWPTAPSNPSLPPLFHFVLDEHGGMAGLAGDSVLARELSTWYETHGFRLLPNAYSPYFDTYNALPNLVNFTTRPVDAALLQITPGETPVLRENAYFDKMRERGYGIRVYQSDYLDFCGGRPSPVLISCFTYPANSVSYAAGLSLPTSSRAGLLAHYLLANRSWFYDRVVAGYNRGIRRGLAATGAAVSLPDGRGSHVSPPISEVLDRVERDLANGAGGTLFFAHLLTPHYPYQFDAQCRVHERVRDRLDRASPSAPDGVDNTPASRERRLALYGEQVRCLMRQLDGFFERLDSLGQLEPAIVVLHGDHGSRIVLRRPEGSANVDSLTRQDLLDGFSTLFAVKAPSLPAGEDTATIAIGEALSHLVASEFASARLGAARTAQPRVWIVDRPRGRMIPVDYRE